MVSRKALLLTSPTCSLLLPQMEGLPSLASPCEGQTICQLFSDLLDPDLFWRRLVQLVSVKLEVVVLQASSEEQLVVPEHVGSGKGSAAFENMRGTLSAA